MAAKRKGKGPEADPAFVAFEMGRVFAAQHAISGSVLCRLKIIRNQSSICPRNGWAVVTQSGTIHVHPTRRAEPAEWAHVLAHCCLHHGFGHFDIDHDPGPEWQTACDIVIERFLDAIKLGSSPLPPGNPPMGNEQGLYRTFKEHGMPKALGNRGVGGGDADMIFDRPAADWHGNKLDFVRVFAEGLRSSLAGAVDQAAGLSSSSKKVTTATLALQWFVSSFPLLGAMASAFKIVEEQAACLRWNIAIAAVDPASREIYINPAAAMDAMECRFVMAHELLHVGLQHVARRQGRDAFLWNIACDFVINGWLIEMNVGHPPSFGVLYDPELKGLNAEAIHDIIVRDMRRFRKLATCRGYALCDILGPDDGCGGIGADLDAFYRSCLAQGLAMHEREGRGFLPRGLVQEIEALSVPPIPWDVRLAQWLDGFFGPLEPVRTYARASRRQSATPDIPRPRVVLDLSNEVARTFGVVLDTSGSMKRELLGKALGAIGSYALSRDVPFVRLVFCDAVAYDEGYVAPESIVGRVRIRGRGGTILQPGVDLLERAADFPPDGPILVITDTFCDHVRTNREHAFLVPVGSQLPFPPRGPVFELE